MREDYVTPKWLLAADRQPVNEAAREGRHRRLQDALLEVLDTASGHLRCRSCGAEFWREAGERLTCLTCGHVGYDHRCVDRRGMIRGGGR